MIVLGLVFSLVACSFAEQPYKIVNLEQGSVKGYKNNEFPVYEFYGIPYATEPKGKDRFGPPKPAPVWEDTLDAVNKNIVCRHVPLFESQEVTLKSGDNCLLANIATPDIEAKNLPVVVIIHGGGYQVGYGWMVKTQQLVTQGKVITVTFNYRLGINGFLCLGTKNIPGNAGLKDQLALLKWVKENIASFGGNPNDVTLTGFSAGSGSVEFHILSEKSKGLFHKAIPESGSALSPWSMQVNPLEEAESFARRVGYTGNSFEDLEKFYLSATDDELYIDNFFAHPNSSLTFAPCVENNVDGEAFIDKTPQEIFKSGSFQRVPTLIGLTNKEGKIRYYYMNFWRDLILQDMSVFLPQNLAFNSKEQKDLVSQTVAEFYFSAYKDGKIAAEEYVDYFSDVMFTYPIVDAIKHYIKAGSKNIYFYEYSYVPEVEHPALTLTKEVEGADHCAQTTLIYDVIDFGVPHRFLTKEQEQKYNKIRQLWINFIKTGQPVPVASDEYPDGWPTTSANGHPYMKIGNEIKLEKDVYLPERVGFWEQIYDKFNVLPSQPIVSEKIHSEL